MSLRHAIGSDARRLHQLVDDLLDKEDVVLLLFDGHRVVNYINGFGLSPCHVELAALEIERTVRANVTTTTSLEDLS
jgi:hypothetical protein